MEPERRCFVRSLSTDFYRGERWEKIEQTDVLQGRSSHSFFALWNRKYECYVNHGRLARKKIGYFASNFAILVHFFSADAKDSVSSYQNYRLGCGNKSTFLKLSFSKPSDAFTDRRIAYTLTHNMRTEILTLYNFDGLFRRKRCLQQKVFLILQDSYWKSSK